MTVESLPKISSYGKYSTSNYGAHTIMVEIPPTDEGQFGIKILFSYETIVAFIGYVDGKNQLVVRNNKWGHTTGRHLNMIDGGNKKARVNDYRFTLLFEDAIRHA